MIKFYLVISVAWFFLLLVAILNGILRNKTYIKRLGDLRAHQISSMIFILIIFIVIYVILNLFNLEYGQKDLWIMGMMWSLATLVFEFVFGHYVMKHSFSELFMDYNVFKGRAWLFVLLAELIGPVLLSG